MAERLRQPRSGSTAWTRQNGPFKLVRTEAFTDRATARRREQFLKTGHGRQELDQIIPR
jgi:predicted GIY-YIG superfamily endonuclease